MSCWQDHPKPTEPAPAASAARPRPARCRQATQCPGWLVWDEGNATPQPPELAAAENAAYPAGSFANPQSGVTARGATHDRFSANRARPAADSRKLWRKSYALPPPSPRITHHALAGIRGADT